MKLSLALTLALTLTASLLTSFTSDANSKRDDPRNQSRNQSRQQNTQALAVQSADHAVAIAQRQYPGKVLNVQSSGNGYRVKLLSKDGQVFSVSVNAQTGRASKN